MMTLSGSLRVQTALLAVFLGCASAQAAPLSDYGPITTDSDHTKRPGAAVWMDLLTDDVATAVKFYHEVFGWDIETSPSGEYAYAEVGGHPVASIAAYDPELGESKGLWIPSISVADADQTMHRVEQAGGTIVEPPEDLPGRGRYLLVEDPTGAAVMMLRANTGDPERHEQINSWCWFELWTDDTAAASKFYEQVVGYRTVSIKDADGNVHEVMGRDHRPYATLVKSPLPDVEPNWLAYILVKDVDATARAALKAGGAVLLPPQKDGFNENVAIIADPTGGVFALQQK